MEDRVVVKIPAKPEMLKIAKVGIYCRVSSTKSEQLYSMAAQVSLLYKLAPQIPGHVVDIYMDFHSGANDDRQELNRLLEDCRVGKVNTIYTKSVSRMARNTVDLLNIIRELRSINVRIIFELENLDTANYETEFLITIIEAYAQEESYKRSENTRWGHTLGIRKADKRRNIRIIQKKVLRIHKIRGRRAYNLSQRSCGCQTHF